MTGESGKPDGRGLEAFIRARLDEDEAPARPEADRYAEWKQKPRDWTRLMCDPVIGPFGGQSPHRDIARGLYVGDMSDPDRVLREVAAKRAILALHRPEPMRYIEANQCPRCAVPWPCDEVRAIAAIYIDHPDYRQEWAPA